jgi:hypothetical protein
MRLVLRRGPFFSLLLALTLPLAACDSGGSDSGSNFIGDWEVVSSEGAFDVGNVWTITRGRVTIRDVGTTCSRNTYTVQNIDGNTLTFESDGDVVVSFEGSGDEVTATIEQAPSSTQWQNSDEAMLQATDNVPDCD